MYAWLLPAKGVDFPALAQSLGSILTELEHLGYKRVIFRSDNEPSLLAFLRVLKQRWSSEVIDEHATTGDPKSNGAAENAVKLVKGLIRSLKDDLESRLGTSIPETHGLLSWLVRQAAYVYRQYSLGPDGRTPHERLTGRRSRPAVAEFCERVWWMPLQTPANRLPPLGARCESGFYLGVSPNSAESFVLTSTGAVRTRTIRRRPEGERWTAELLETDKITVLQPNGPRPEDPRIGIRAPVWEAPRQRSDPEPLPTAQSPAPRRTKLQRGDFSEHGLTPGCPGCIVIQHGLGGEAHHNGACRARMEEILAETYEGRRRLEQAENRFSRYAERSAVDEPSQTQQVEEPQRSQVPDEIEPVPPVPPVNHREAAKRKRDEVDELQNRNIRSHLSDSATASSSSDAPVPRNKRSAETSVEDLDAERSSDDLLDMLWLHSGESRVNEQGAVCEVYSPPRIAPVAEKRGLGPGWSLDLTTCDSEGRPWNFDDPGCRERARQLVRSSRPLLLVGSPMCTWFSQLQAFNQRHMDPREFRRNMDRARAHLKFVFELYQEQLQAGRYFLHEQPAHASSWKEPCVLDLLARFPDLYLVTSDLCQFGLVTDGPNGPVAAKKPTRWLTNSPCLADRLDRKCDGAHIHQTLLNGRAKGAQVYPPGLCAAIVEGFKRQLHTDAAQQASTDSPLEVPAFNLEILAADPEDPEEPKAEDWQDWVARDDVHGGELPAHLVHQARCKELRYLQDRNVYAYSTWKEAIRNSGKPPLKLKWIDSNKGDEAAPRLRSRLVCTEVRPKGAEAIFSATPPLETLRALIAKAACEDPGESRDPYKILLVDVSRAHFYAPATREVYIRLPPEDPKANDGTTCGKLLRTMYGTLDAADHWAEHYSKVLAAAGFERGKASPCHFYHREHDAWVLVHGDDFLCVSRTDGREHLRNVLSQNYEIKTETIGPAVGDQKELRVLGRVVRYSDLGDGLTLEADPTHLELVIDQLGLAGANAVTSPGAREETEVSHQELQERRLQAIPVPHDEEQAAALTGDQLKAYQSLAARLNFYSLDRVDIQFAIKELMRKLGSPDEADWLSLKRVARYLLGAERALVRYPWAPLSTRIQVYADSDHAGCHRTRKSTYGGVILWGQNFLKSWSRTMQLLALSSGEAELCAVTKGAAEGLGVQALLSDFGFTSTVELHSDATAAIGICRRLGLGRVRHLAVSDLWLQQRVRQGDLTVHKVPGKQNPADILTKYRSARDSFGLLQRVGIFLAPGRPASAPVRCSFVIGSRVSAPPGFVHLPVAGAVP